MSWRRNLTLGFVAGGMAVGGLAAAQGIAQARQAANVITRFQFGYFDSRGHFVPTAGRGSTNVDRNAVMMFLFSGPVDLGPNKRASLPLTLDEQATLAAEQATDPDFDLIANGFEPGVIPRKLSVDPSAYFVATGSINPTSVVIAAPQVGGTLNVANGQFFKMLRPHTSRPYANRLLFNPRYTVSAFNQPSQIDYNPQGFDASTAFIVYVDGGTRPLHPFEMVRDPSGQGMALAFSTTFGTSNRYVQDYTNPKVVSTIPGDGSQSVQADADIELTFTEPMDIASFITPRFQGDDAWTVIARYTQSPINGQLLQGKNLLLQVRIKPQTGGNVIQLRPLQGFGKGPQEIEVILRNGVTDLSGNNISRQIQFTFKTVHDDNADVAGFVVENFDNDAFKDPNFGVALGYPAPTGDNVLASWPATPPLPQANPGFLYGVLASRQFVAVGPNEVTTAGFGVNLWGVSAIRFQNLYPVADMGARARTITGFAWRIAAQTYVGYSYINTMVQIGHATDLIESAGFPGTATAATGPTNANFRDTPVLVAPTSTYSSVTNPSPLLAGGYIAGPSFVRSFNSDGKNSVILDIQHGGSGGSTTAQERWVLDSNYVLQTNTYNNTSFGQTGANPWYFTTRFTFLTPGAEHQSLFYDLGRDDARTLPQQIVPTTQPQGTTVTFTWQGAKTDSSTGNTPDLTTLTPFVQDVRQLTGYRFIKFHVVMTNNLTGLTFPTVDSITLPYAYR